MPAEHRKERHAGILPGRIPGQLPGYMDSDSFRDHYIQLPCGERCQKSFFRNRKPQHAGRPETGHMPSRPDENLSVPAVRFQQPEIPRSLADFEPQPPSDGKIDQLPLAPADLHRTVRRIMIDKSKDRFRSQLRHLCDLCERIPAQRIIQDDPVKRQRHRIPCFLEQPLPQRPVVHMPRSLHNIKYSKTQKNKEAALPLCAIFPL